MSAGLGQGLPERSFIGDRIVKLEYAPYDLQRDFQRLRRF